MTDLIKQLREEAAYFDSLTPAWSSEETPDTAERVRILRKRVVLLREAASRLEHLEGAYGEAVEGLRPFAHIAEVHLGKPFGDEHVVYVKDVHGFITELFVRPFRRARAIVEAADRGSSRSQPVADGPAAKSEGRGYDEFAEFVREIEAHNATRALAQRLWRTLKQARDQVVSFALDTLDAERAKATVKYIDDVLRPEDSLNSGPQASVGIPPPGGATVSPGDGVGGSGPGFGNDHRPWGAR